MQCLQEFAVYAKQYDIAHQTKPAFQLPYKIEGDKICGHTIRLRFNVNDKWTKALKYLLANLKVTLVWLTSSGPWEGRTNTDSQTTESNELVSLT